MINPLDKLLQIAEYPDQVDQYDIIEVQATQPDPNAPTPPVEKDEEDVDTDAKIDEVYTVAMQTFTDQMSYIESIDPRYAARTAEVAATYLSLALSAANSKAKIKTDRKRTNTFIPGAQGKTTNNLIVANREEILRMINVDGKTGQGDK